MKIAVSTEMDYLGNPQRTRILVNQDYIQYVLAAGYSPFIVGVGMDVDAIADAMDGLLLTGGKDLHPLIYGQDVAKWGGSNACNLTRDTFEMDLYHAFVARAKPVFGICRGFQLVVILSAEGSIAMRQDIGSKEVNRMHNQGAADILGDNPVHEIITRGVLREMVGEKMNVNSFHHQGFLMKGETMPDSGFVHQDERVFAWARSEDKALVLEAFGMMSYNAAGQGARVAGVQWHPERMMRGDENQENHLALFQYTMGTRECEWERTPPTTRPVENTPLAPMQQPQA